MHVQDYTYKSFRRRREMIYLFPRLSIKVRKCLCQQISIYFSSYSHSLLILSMQGSDSMSPPDDCICILFPFNSVCLVGRRRRLWLVSSVVWTFLILSSAGYTLSLSFSPFSAPKERQRGLRGADGAACQIIMHQLPAIGGGSRGIG